MTFTPGQSGNPAGRRRGSRNRVNLLLDKMASADATAVLQAVLDKAKGRRHTRGADHPVAHLAAYEGPYD
jgi:hypothetical protein